MMAAKQRLLRDPPASFAYILQGGLHQDVDVVAEAGRSVPDYVAGFATVGERQVISAYLGELLAHPDISDVDLRACMQRNVPNWAFPAKAVRPFLAELKASLEAGRSASARREARPG